MCDPARFVSKYAGNINIFEVVTLVKKHEAVCTTTQTGSYGIADVDGHVGETANQPCSHNMGVILSYSIFNGSRMFWLSKISGYFLIGKFTAHARLLKTHYFNLLTNTKNRKQSKKLEYKMGLDLF